MTKIKSNISLANMLNFKSIWAKPLVGLLDRLLGLHKVNRFYQSGQLPGKSSQAFAAQFLQELEIKVKGCDNLSQTIPQTGSLILVANHPFGCVEGVALAHELKKHRGDVKVLANKALSMFEELKSFFIFINPLSTSDPKNIRAIRQCKQHLSSGGVLLIFPAGKVSYYRPDKQRVCDGPWNRLPAQLAKLTSSPVLPVFIEGQNSQLFINLGRVYYRLKLIMLFREMLKHRGKPIQIKLGKVLPFKFIDKFDDTTQLTEYLRVQTYLLSPDTAKPWPATQQQKMAEIMPQVNKAELKAQIDSLPQSQHLYDYKTFSVYFARQQQAPLVVKEISRLREVVFRQYDEGSGEPCDTDEFDSTYLHLFIFNHGDGEIIGAYRMGQTDELIKQGGVKALYLAKMFNFSEQFINQQQPCLEMGRSFLVPEHQRSFYGLFLLWRGIGEFAVRHPQYRTLYGTVSLSKLYQRMSVECINQLATKPSSNVSANSPFTAVHNLELNDYINSEYANKAVGSMSPLSSLVMGIEQDGKDIPVLMKQYQKMGARFYCIGIDNSFNDTPGLLLSVDLSNAPDKALNQYLAEGKQSYLQYRSGQG